MSESIDSSDRRGAISSKRCEHDISDLKDRFGLRARCVAFWDVAR